MLKLLKIVDLSRPLPDRPTGQIAIADCSHLVGHVKHEMMHIMGFYHEHSRYHYITYFVAFTDSHSFKST